MKIYVCSSWRNPHYPQLLDLLKVAGHLPWDWRNPPTGGHGFKWEDTGAADYKHGGTIRPDQWRKMLGHPVAVAGFASDMCGMEWCDIGVLLHPCGRSAHLEAGYIAGRGKKVHILCPADIEPDLMVLALRGKIFADSTSLLNELASPVR
jgi:hypothetical protein